MTNEPNDKLLGSKVNGTQPKTDGNDKHADSTTNDIGIQANNDKNDTSSDDSVEGDDISDEEKDGNEKPTGSKSFVRSCYSPL